jgi:jasmonate ZIM domain-containing protein
MPGADVDATTASEDPAESGSAVPAPPLPAQMTIVYGERVLVLDGVPAERAAGLLRLAAAAAATRGGAAAVMMEPRAGADLPVARKASLQRFMEKRKGRAAARAEPYSRRTTDGGDACPAAEDHLKLAL